MIFRILRRSALPFMFRDLGDVAEIDDGNRTVTYADGRTRCWEDMSEYRQAVLEGWCSGASAHDEALVLTDRGEIE